jgi:glycosyltransferase involved in cell wall biosynthesis
MRVCLVALHFAEYTARLALELARHHEVQIHLSETNAEMELSADLWTELERSTHLVRHQRPVRKLALFQGFRLAALILRFRPDVIHAQEAGAWTLLAMLILMPFRPPFVLTVHDPLPHTGIDQLARARTRLANSRLRKWANKIIVHGSSAAKDMITAEPSTAGRIHSVEHGILGKFVTTNVDPGIASFLFFGRIQAYKGLGILIQACAILSKRGLCYRATIAGRGPDLDVHRSEIAANPLLILDERFIPPEEVPLLFCRATAIVMPYLDATQSGVAAHAFSARRPIIASRVGGLPDIIEEGMNGLLVPPGDADALADAMSMLVTDKDLAARLAAGAEMTASSKLSWQHIAQETVKVYASAKGGGAVVSKTAE